MNKFAAAAAVLALTASAAFAQGVQIKSSEVYQDSLASYYMQYNGGSGDQTLAVNDISGEVKIKDSYVSQYNTTDLYQVNWGAGDQDMFVNRIHGE